MLEFCKNVLRKVSFDRFLFTKELKKAIKWLKNEDRNELKQWCLNNYGHVYQEIIIDSFGHTSLAM